MKKLSFLIPVFTAACTHPAKPIPETPTVFVPKVYFSAVEEHSYDVVSSINMIISGLQPAVGKAEYKTIMHLNADSGENEEKNVYRLQEPAVKIPLYNAYAIISLRDIYHDGNSDLEIRVISEEGDIKMKIYRDLFPFGSLDEVDKCGIEWDEAARITYYPCSRIANDGKENRSFANIINRLASKLEDKVPASGPDYKYVESKYILERSEGVIHLTKFESPYK